ncbi:T9SS type A sorting domain-containing protein [uncultured Pontibacter sp.]|uniref:T9SS type A sorting domain-containing protein n=1 Tax=uncultured Pontibacter sp. TaxID=453356 RepID=UPI00261FE40E|nr:T9SS type A sorting domain-containing protein [uncultured Pontibacter sp.]
MIIKYTALICILLFYYQAFAQQSQGFVSVKELAPLPVSRNTGEKPQSKVWSYKCKQWAVLADKSGTYLWRLDNNKWRNVLKLSDKLANADCKIVDDIAHIFLFTGEGKSYLVSLEYSSESGTYKFWSAQPTPSPVSLAEGAKTATIDIDSKGRMWLASDAAPNIKVRWSDSPYTNWSNPIDLVSNISINDIGAIIAMPNKVGVMWSNQKAKRFGFRTHTDGDAPEVWSGDEVPASQSALDVHLGMADDHLNMTVASDGTLYCAIKTEYDTKGYPKIALLVRRPSGTWDNLYEVSQKGTRPIVILNEEKNKVKVVYTAKDLDGEIVYKESDSKNISFSPELPLIKNGAYNNVSSSKGPYNNDVVILASDSTQAVGVLALDDQPSDKCDAVQDWIIYPNPFSANTNLYFSLQHNGRYKVLLYDTTGALVAKLNEGEATAGAIIKIEIDGTKLSRGLYFVKVQTQERTKSMKLVLAN